MRKIVDATKGKLSVTDAVLAIERLELILASPDPNKAVPHWLASLSLKADADLLAMVTKELPFNINTNPVQVIKNNIAGADLAGWTVTRFVDEE